MWSLWARPKNDNIKLKVLTDDFYLEIIRKWDVQMWSY